MMGRPQRFRHRDNRRDHPGRMRGLFVPLAMTLAVGGCLDPAGESFGTMTCPVVETVPLAVTVEGRDDLRHVVLVGGWSLYLALDCDAPWHRPDLAAVDGRVQATVDRQSFAEVRLFFPDGTLRHGVELPDAGLDLRVTSGDDPVLTDHGRPVEILRHEWLQGAEAGADAYHGEGFVPLRSHNETMAVVVTSSWNQRLLFQAALSYEPYVSGEKPPEGTGSIHLRVVAPNGTVAFEQTIAQPQGHASVQLPPGAPVGTWTAEFGFTASTTPGVQMLSSVSSWIEY
jgi:hypothetical protein